MKWLVGLAVGVSIFAFVEFADNGVRSVQDLRNENLAAIEEIEKSFEESSNKIKTDQEALAKAQQDLIKDFVESYDDSRIEASSVDRRKRLEELRVFVAGRIADSLERVREAEQDLEELRFKNSLRFSK